MCRVRVCVHVWGSRGERKCDWLHVTVCDPWLCLLLYIVPAIRIGHDLKYRKPCPCHLLGDVPVEHRSPTYFSVTRYFCQLLECGDNPEPFFFFRSHTCFDNRIAGLWCVVQFSVLIWKYFVPLDDYRQGYSIFLLFVPIEQLPEVFIERRLLVKDLKWWCNRTVWFVFPLVGQYKF